ncbi:hypothetical protein F0U62_49755 [Cystobacter fuscus]|uniref:hypothetical protein n=1 Tax=Cystobacter fuscus TaxID=43 RepID=UPI002B2D6C01|nr:hypothetical protein F0U62_49755 [Cystobacter fuscus]
MIVVASDIHLTDRLSGDPVTDTELVRWLEMVEQRWNSLRGENPDEPLEFVFLGDIVDILRSREWDTAQAMPWTGLDEGFTSFQHGYQEETATRAAESTLKRYPSFFLKLAQLRAEKARVQYVPGNHDFMVQCSPGARGKVAEAFGLTGGALAAVYQNESLRLWAEHGHAYDSFNLHQAASGQWAFGDAVVLLFVNRLAGRIAEQLNIPEWHPLTLALQRLDNVEPSWLLPQFIARTIQDHLVNKAEREKANKEVKEVAKELLSHSHFATHSDQTIRHLFELLVRWDLAGLATSTRAAIDQFLVKDNLARHAYTVHRESKDKDLIIFGHTHHTEARPLMTYERNTRGVMYVNTGTWRSVQLSATMASNQLDQFWPIRTYSWLEVHRERKTGRVLSRLVHERVL